MQSTMKNNAVFIPIPGHETSKDVVLLGSFILFLGPPITSTFIQFSVLQNWITQ